MLIPTAQPQPIMGVGDLSYTMEATVGQLGETTTIKVVSNHGLPGIAPTWVIAKYCLA